MQVLQCDRVYTKLLPAQSLTNSRETTTVVEPLRIVTFHFRRNSPGFCSYEIYSNAEWPNSVLNGDALKGRSDEGK
jgi:hypothetical protein